MKNSINVILLSICLLTGMAKSRTIHTYPDSNICLELRGKINAGEATEKPATYLIIIEQLHFTPDTFIMKSGTKKFSCLLGKNRSYTVTIIKAGYCHKSFVISTALPEYDDKLYQFYFEAMMQQSDAAHNSICKGHAPVAQVYFDCTRRAFTFQRQSETIAAYHSTPQ